MRERRSGMDGGIKKEENDTKRGKENEFEKREIKDEKKWKRRKMGSGGKKAIEKEE